MKTRIFKILVAAAGVALVLILTVLPALAMVINVTVTYIGGSEGLAVGFYYKTSDAENFTLYTEGNGPTASYSEFDASGYLELTNQAIQQGYDGFFLFLTEEESYGLSVNLVSDYLAETNIKRLANGYYYVASGDVFYFTKSTGHLYLAGIPCNYDQAIVNIAQIDFDSGYRKGQAEAAARIAELESSLAVYMDESTTQGQALQQAYRDGAQDMQSNLNFVGTVFKETGNSVGSVLEQLFNLQVLGIPLYEFALLGAVVPLTFFLVKVCIHH